MPAKRIKSPHSKPIRLLIADDHAIVRTGLTTLLETVDGIKVVGEADDGAAAVKKTLKLRPDIVIMDLMMPVMDGITAIREIKAKLPQTKVLILTTSTVSDDLAKAIEAGAEGAVTKATANAKLITALRAISAGKRWISPEISELIEQDPPAPSLTPRQGEILDCVTRGLTNKDIARLLGISERMVEEHIEALFQKIGAANRAEAVAIALRKHLLKI